MDQCTSLHLPREHGGGLADISLELQQLRHCLAVVARCAAVELAVAMPTLFTPGLRRLLWAALSAWSQDASPEAKPGTYRADVCIPRSSRIAPDTSLTLIHV